ncbi:MAG: hypothetical protein KDA32_10115 [Phycisphaerales bacterium]|nr:hypothetical protein [Phycisphaerales bacterium]
MKVWVLFVIIVVLCWGAYVPTIHAGQTSIGNTNRMNSAMWAFLFVGLAYCLLGVAVPIATLASKGAITELPAMKGAQVSLLAGLLGAAGALGVIFALNSGGTPLTVPPLVFAGAPIVATLITMTMHPPKSAPSWPFFVGILLAATGAGLVLRFKPS